MVKKKTVEKKPQRWTVSVTKRNERLHLIFIVSITATATTTERGRKKKIWNWVSVSKMSTRAKIAQISHTSITWQKILCQYYESFTHVQYTIKCLDSIHLQNVCYFHSSVRCVLLFMLDFEFFSYMYFSFWHKYILKSLLVAKYGQKKARLTNTIATRLQHTPIQIYRNSTVVYIVLIILIQYEE